MTAARTFLLATAFAMAGTAAYAQDTPAEQTYWDLRAGVVAYERCNDLRFNQEQETALNAAIMQRVAERLGAGVKLTLIEESKYRTAMRVHTKGGCTAATSNEVIEQALELFQTELAAAVGM